MNKIKMQRYETVIYIALFLLAIILMLVGNYIIIDGTTKAVFINLSSELLAVGILFFILKRLFLLGDDTSSNRTEEYMSITRRIFEKQSKEHLQGIDLTIKEINKIKESSDRNSLILDAIRAESSLADKINERMEINDKLTNLSAQLKITESLLSEKERDQKRTSEWLSEKVSALTEKIISLEFALNKNITEVGTELKNKQEMAIDNFRKTISSSEAASKLSSEVNRNLPALIRPSNPAQMEKMQDALSEAISKKVVGSYMGKVSETLNQLGNTLTESYDTVASSRKEQLIAELNEIKRQIQELDKEIQ